MNKIWEILILIVPVVCSSVCTVLTVRADHKVKKKSNTDKALMFLMKGQMRMRYEKFMADGYIDDADLGTFEEMYEVYHNLGGNGTGTIWKNDLERLERR